MQNLENYQKIERTTLTMEEVDKYLGISYWLVCQLVKRKEIHHFRMGGRVLFRKKDIDEYMEEQEKAVYENV